MHNPQTAAVTPAPRKGITVLSHSTKAELPFSPYPCRARWKWADSLCTHTASNCGDLVPSPSLQAALQIPMFTYFIIIILCFKGLNLPPANRRSTCFVIQYSRLWQYPWKVTLSTFNMQKFKTAVLSHSPFVYVWLKGNIKFKAAKARIWTAWKMPFYLFIYYTFH